MAKQTLWFSRGLFSSVVNRTELIMEDLENRIPPAAHTIIAASTAADTLTVGTLNTAEASGDIATANQQDLYRIHLGTGDQVTAAVTAQLAGSGLEPILRVFSVYGQELALDNQEGGDPDLTFQANAPGDYFIGVSSAGNSQYNPTVSNSGSTGATTGLYTLDLSVKKNQPLESDLASSSFRLTQTTAAWGDTVQASFNIENRGGANAGAFSVQVYVSPDPTINPSNSTALLTTPLAMDFLTAGTKWSVNGLSLTLPARLGTLISGPVYIGLRITTNPVEHSGTFDKGGVHRGEDFESLTIVTPVTRTVADLAQVDPALNLRINGTLGVAQLNRYPFTVSQAGQFTVRGQPSKNSSVLLQLALYGGTNGQTLLVESQAEITNPIATLSEFIQPGTYYLNVTSAQTGNYQLTTTMTLASSPLQPIPTGQEPVSIAVGDFNNDGHLDLATANSNDNTVSILLGNGDGSFQQEQTVTVGSYPVAVAVGDFNGDGKPDLVVTNEDDNTVGVLLGNGDGTFSSTQTPYTVGSDPDSVAVADLTGNGILDIVVANYGSNTVGVLLGNGDGTFQPMQTYAVGQGPISVAVSDLTDDGIPDIVVANYASNTVGVLLGEGNGTFGSMHSFTVGSEPRSVVVADVNGDGNPDLLVANSSTSDLTVPGTVSILLGNGKGSFSSQSTVLVGTQPTSLAVADLNNDGKLDIVVSNFNDDTVSYLFGNGDGTFSNRLTAIVPQEPDDVVVADLNGDGHPDLIVADSGLSNSSPDVVGSSVSILLGNTDGTFLGQPAQPANGNPVALAVADFNGDGLPDVAAAVEDSQPVSATALATTNLVTIELGNGDGTFSPQAPLTVGTTPFALAAADLNSDGKMDLLVANMDDNTVGVLLGNGDGTFRPEVTYPVGVGPCSLALADLRGNGITDIVVANNGDDTVGVLLGNGDGTYRPEVIYTVGVSTDVPTHQVGGFPGSGPISVALADLLGNGKQDIIVTNDQDSTIDVLLGNGNGTFQPELINHVVENPYALAVADVNGDGKPDIIVTNPNSNTVGVLLGNGNGTFQTERTFGTGDGPYGLAVADLTGDGKIDLVVTNEDDQTVSVLLGNGNGSFQLQRTFGVGVAPYAVAVADVNDDGKPDILVGNIDSATITTLLGNGDGTFTLATTTNSVAAPNTAYSVDLTGAANSTGQPILDNVVLNSAGSILFRQGQPDDNNLFAPPVTLNPTLPSRDLVPLQTPTGWVVAAADRSTPGQTGYTVSLYSVSVNGQVNTRTTAFSTSLLPTRIFAADLSGNGRNGDLVLLNTLNNSIQVAIQRLNGSFGPLLTLATGEAPSDVTFADINGDGLLDIIVTNQASGDVSIFLNDSTHSFVRSERIRAGTSPFNLQTFSTISIVAGDNFLPYSGNGGLATAAVLNNPGSVAVDASGNLYIADTGNNVIREVMAATGKIYTIAGNGSPGYSGDTGLAIYAELNGPEGVAVDAAGDIYIADTNNEVIREIPAGSNDIYTIAGDNSSGYSGDGELATSAELDSPYGLAVDSDGNLYIADSGNNVIREVSATTGIITTIAGNSTSGYSGDGGSATNAELDSPYGVAVDSTGNIYIADTDNNVIREVVNGIISTFAGDNTSGYSGDGGSATAAELDSPYGLAVDAHGNLYIDDFDNNVVREVMADTGVITTVAGDGVQGDSGDGGKATSAELDTGYGIAVDASGNLYIADTFNNVIREVAADTQVITSIAGNGSTASSGDGGPATSAQLNSPYAVTVDAAGNLYIADYYNNVIREVAASSGVITTVAGDGSSGYSGDGGLATLAKLNHPGGVAVDAEGNLYIADTGSNVIREVAAGSHIITTIAGNRSRGDSGDGGLATSAELNSPYGLAVDGSGNLYIDDYNNNVIREVAAGTHVITTVAGDGIAGYSGDGGPATSAELDNGYGIALDAAGNLYIADAYNDVIREVMATTHVITTVAGQETTTAGLETSTAGYSGDGGPATSAELDLPEGVAVDAAGNLFIADSDNNVIREVAAGTHIITTIAGNGLFGFSGDGGPATSAAFDDPYELAVDAAGNLFIADNSNNVIREVALGASQTQVASLAESVSLTAGNFTGDGNEDLLVVNRGTHSFTILPNNGSGGFASPQVALTTSTSDGLTINNDPGPVVAGDFNTADGLDTHRVAKDDVAILMEDTGEVWIFTNNGNGTFQHTFSIYVGLGATGLSLVPGSKSGLDDLLVGDQAGDLLRLIGNGDGIFQPQTGTSVTIAAEEVGSTNTPIAVVADQQTNLVNVQSPTNGSTFSTVATLADNEDPSAQLAPGDVTLASLEKNKTLPPDAIVIASGSNEVLVYRAIGLNATGNSILAPAVSYPTGTDPVNVTVADINGDGIPDLLIANQASNDVSVIFGSYDSDGDWVGTAGPRLKSAGVGPISANLIPDSNSPGGQDLAITNQDGTVDLLPGRGQGFFDDRNPRIIATGATLVQSQVQPPVVGAPILLAVSNSGSLMQINLTNSNAPVTTVPDSESVLGVQLIPGGNPDEVIEFRSGGAVDEVNTTTGKLVLALSSLNSIQGDFSDLAVIGTDTDPEALVTTENSNTIYEFTAISTGTGEPVTAELGHEVTSVGSALALASTLFTTTSSPGGTGPTPAGPGFNTLLTASAIELDPGLLARIGALSDESLVPTTGEQLLASLRLDFVGLSFSTGPDPLGADGSTVPTTRDGVVTGTAEALEKLAEAVRGGTWPGTAPGTPPTTGKEDLLQNLLKSLSNLPQGGQPPTPPKEQSPQEPDEIDSQIDSIAVEVGSVINTDRSTPSTTDEIDVIVPVQTPDAPPVSEGDGFELLTNGVEVGPLEYQSEDYGNSLESHRFEDQSDDEEVVFASLLLFSPALVRHDRDRRGSMVLSSWMRDNAP